MTGWSQVSAAAGGGRKAVEYVDVGRESSARFSSEVRGSRFEQRRKNCSLLELSEHLEEGVVPQSWMLSSLDSQGAGGRGSGLAYLEVRAILERKLAHSKRGLLSRRELAEAVSEFKDERDEGCLDAAVVEEEIRRLNASMMRCDVEPVGGMSPEKQKIIRARILIAADSLKEKLPSHPAHPSGRNPYAHIPKVIKE